MHILFITQYMCHIYLTWWATAESLSAASRENSEAAIQISALSALMMRPDIKKQAALTYEPQEGYVSQTLTGSKGRLATRKRKSLPQAGEEAGTLQSDGLASKRVRKAKNH
jgi:hypothetical protein